MRITVERISNGNAAMASRVRAISPLAESIAEEVLGEIKDKSEAIRSIARIAQDKRKGVVIIRIPESVRAEVRSTFDLPEEPEEFVIQCKSGKDQDKELVLVTVGFLAHSKMIEMLENWLIEEPVDGTEAHTIATSRKINYAVSQISDIVKDIRGRQK